MQVQPASYRRAVHPAGLLLVVLLLWFLPLVSQAKTAQAVPGKFLDLSSYLIKTAPPAQLFQSTSSVRDEAHWYRLNLELNTDLSDSWLLVFRRVPYSRLDVFLPVGDGFRLHALGQRQSLTTQDPRTLELSLQEGINQTIYIRASSPIPNRLVPQLWPGSPLHPR